MTPEKFQNLEEGAVALRSALKAVANDLKEFKERLGHVNPAETEDRGEVMVNIMLSYRHIEDARMRLGKVIEAHKGVNIFEERKIGE